ncbi:Unknown protein sequence [Pseudomonas coronafaciens pv. oryzae]|nr:Unknown protein sequence [Pseudomonas coronafaciens pv. oryzae]
MRMSTHRESGPLRQPLGINTAVQVRAGDVTSKADAALKAGLKASAALEKRG